MHDEVVRSWTVLGAALFVLMSARAFAQPSPADIGVAQRAFDDGVKLFNAKSYPAACEKFELSQKLDPKLGTLLNLALCHEKIGRFSLASTEFHDARSIAVSENHPDRIEFADRHLAVIEPHLGSLKLRFEGAVPEGVRITLDGTAINPASVASTLGVDGGRHQVQVTLAEHQPYEGSVECAEGKPCELVIPKLVRLSSSAPPTLPPVADRSSHGARIAGAVLLGVGFASLAVGGVTGALALGSRARAEDLCAASRCAEGQAENDRGMAFAWTSNVTLVVGAVAVITGLVLVIVDPGRAPRPMTAGFAF